VKDKVLRISEIQDSVLKMNSTQLLSKLLMTKSLPKLIQNAIQGENLHGTHQETQEKINWRKILCSTTKKPNPLET